MTRMEFSIQINAPRERVWHTMLDDATYRVWTAGFHEGSHYVGSWTPDTVIRFLGPGEDGKLAGMLSRVREVRPLEHVALTVIGLVHDGVEDLDSDAVRAWSGAIEEYTFRDTAQGTEVLIAVDTPDPWAAMMRGGWNDSLARLKALCEG